MGPALTAALCGLFGLVPSGTKLSAQDLPQARCTLAQNHVCQRGQCAPWNEASSGALVSLGRDVRLCMTRNGEERCAVFSAEVVKVVPPGITAIARLAPHPGAQLLGDGVYMLDITSSGSFVLTGMRGGMTMLATGPCQPAS